MKKMLLRTMKQTMKPQIQKKQQALRFPKTPMTHWQMTPPLTFQQFLKPVKQWKPLTQRMRFRSQPAWKAPAHLP